MFKEKNKKRIKKKLHNIESEHRNRLVSKNGNVIRFPERLFLDQNGYDGVFSLMKEIEDKDFVVLDFSETKYVDIGSICYIRAFMDYIKNEKKGHKVKCWYQNKKMRQILQHVGIKDYKFRNITYPDIKCWYVRVWKKDDQINMGKEIMENILPKVLNNRIMSDEFKNITPSLIEILSNCSEHAYPEEDKYNSYYLIAGEYENINHERSGDFGFAVVDLGQGFRSSLKKRHNILVVDDDSKLLEDAINGKITSKEGGGKDLGRGTGLLSVLNYIKRIGGSLHAYSDKGLYEVYRSNNSGDGMMSFRKDRKVRMKGSIIEIGLPLFNQNRNS